MKACQLFDIYGVGVPSGSLKECVRVSVYSCEDLGALRTKGICSVGGKLLIYSLRVPLLKPDT